MVLTHPFYCPVRCVEGHRYFEATAALLAGRPYALVTSQGWIRRGAVQRLIEACGAPVATADNITANPTISQVRDVAKTLKDCDLIVALGGGSVIDAAKGVTVINALPDGFDGLMSHLQEGTPLPSSPETFSEILAIPTTSGTGAEVTRWGTLWGDDGKKYSVIGQNLYPSHAILDPELTVSMPTDVTLATGLDALSHAMEAVWNKRHTDLSNMMALQAIRLIVETLPIVLREPENLIARRRMQTASLLAGQAMGTTQTAIAHSMSYPFTARYDLPHGIACSFTLAEVIRFNALENTAQMQPIADGFGCSLEDLADRVEEFMKSVGIAESLGQFMDKNAAEAFGDDLITPARAANNMRSIDGPSAKALAATSLSRLMG